jgi:hypothetical protein
VDHTRKFFLSDVKSVDQIGISLRIPGKNSHCRFVKHTNRIRLEQKNQSELY